jgi:pimeloyl-ACP methyl ester carboxylesterase
LHTLLARAGLRGPYVLVAHSIGGLYVRVYTGIYQNEVAGMVLVDADHEDLRRWEPKGFVWELGMHQIGLQAYAKPVQARLGILRLRNKPNAGDLIKALPLMVQGAATALGFRSQAYDWVLYEGPAVKETGEQVCAAAPLPNIPLVVLSASRRAEAGLPQPASYWQGLQGKLAQLSPQGKHIIVNPSDHFISDHFLHLSQPEVVVDAIRQTVESIRCNTPKQEG